MVIGMCRSFRDRALDRCYHCFPCLSDPARRSSLVLKVTLVMLHLVYVGILFLFDSDLIDKTKKEPWYTALYLLLFFAALVQYFITSGSSPGYVLDAMRVVNETNVICKKSSMAKKQNWIYTWNLTNLVLITFKQRQPASSKNGSLPVEGCQSGRNFQGTDSTSWTKLVMDMYPPGTSIRSCICSYCNVEQPPRAKHCYDCDKCVLHFDHHCVWLGTCIGQGNHCKFWWYICEESALCLWTGILYITYLRANISRACYLILTNQTTYELVRRRRIPYLRGIPERVYPFSKGVRHNLYDFCCGGSNIYSLEPLPSAQELEEKSRPYTCLDVLTCRCC
ncbi:hypothetical protein CXB51_027944 [Gossypium anomalum]|uniref:S-acyltransferase n=1 Tax=Gossypium anomalum TaxID=47600 RepID=A0A8J6CP68_9ROSI|nr:hypothetical protein CXB51_027944 [Gossypium anomalum]